MRAKRRLRRQRAVRLVRITQQKEAQKKEFLAAFVSNRKCLLTTIKFNFFTSACK